MDEQETPQAPEVPVDLEKKLIAFLISIRERRNVITLWPDDEEAEGLR